MILFSKFRQQAQTLFLDKESPVVTQTDTKYHIVLSPTLYWVKREKLPLKYLHEVKKIAPTLFEEMLPKGDYSYALYKDGEEFILFAYEDKKILELLAQKGISANSIVGISFAQTAFDALDEAVRINDREVLTKKDGIVVVLPSAWFDTALPLEKIVLKPSDPIVKLEQFSHIIDKKTLYKIGLLLFIFVSVLMVEYFYYSKNLNMLVEEKAKIFQNTKLKPTLMQNRAILSHYQSAILRQEKLREYMGYLLKAKLKKDEKIVAIKYGDKKLQIVFEHVNKNALKRILSSFYKKKIKLDIKQKAKELIVEVEV